MIDGLPRPANSSHAPHLMMADSNSSDNISTRHHRSSSDPSRDQDASPASQKKTVSSSAAYEMVPLQPGFEPTSLDVICARGKEAFNHSGNIRFRQLVQDNLHMYSSSTSKMEKSKIVRDIIESVRLASPQGGFVKKVNGEWFDVGERARREKTGQQIRDLLHTSYKSSTKAKARTRKNMRSSGNERLPPRSVSAPLKSSVSQAAAARPAFSSRLPKRIVTLDSKARNSSAFPRFGTQFRDNEPDLNQAAGLQTIQGLNLFTQQQQSTQQLQGQMSSSMANFMQQQQQQQPTMAERLQLQQQLNQQQNQLLPQQQQMMFQQQQQQQQQQHGLGFNQDQHMAFNNNLSSSNNNNFGMASQQSSFLSSMGSLAQQQQQFDSSRASMGNNMSSMSNPFLSGGANNNSMGNTGFFLQQNDQQQRMMGSGMRYGISTEPDLEPIMPGAVYDNDTSGSTFVDESEMYEESFDTFHHGGYR